MIYQKEPKKRRLAKIQKKIKGDKNRPRLSVFRSNKYIYTQIIDDEKEITLISASEHDLKGLEKKPKKTKKQNSETKVLKNNLQKLTKTEKASLVGEIIARKAIKKGIKKVAFDRRTNKYHGRIKTLAEAARKQGLIF